MKIRKTNRKKYAPTILNSLFRSIFGTPMFEHVLLLIITGVSKSSNQISEFYILLPNRLWV